MKFYLFPISAMKILPFFTCTFCSGSLTSIYSEIVISTIRNFLFPPFIKSFGWIGFTLRVFNLLSEWFKLTILENRFYVKTPKFFFPFQAYSLPVLQLVFSYRFDSKLNLKSETSFSNFLFQTP